MTFLSLSQRFVVVSSFGPCLEAQGVQKMGHLHVCILAILKLYFSKNYWLFNPASPVYEIGRMTLFALQIHGKCLNRITQAFYKVHYSSS